MIPHLTLRERLIAWLLWHLEGFGKAEDAAIYIFKHPNLLTSVNLLRDYYYDRAMKEATYES